MRFPLRLAAVSVAAALLLTAAAPVGAHGILERSEPPAGVSLQSSPSRVILWFSEPLDPILSSASVSDAQGRKVSGRVMVASGRRSLIVPVEGPRKGLFTVTWQVLSAADGHVTRGAFLFGIGQPVPGGPTPQAAPPDPLSVAARWGAFLAAILLAGSVFFQLLVLHPVARKLPPSPDADDRTAARLRRLQTAAGMTFLVAVVGEFLLTAGSLIEPPLFEALRRGLLWPLIFSTKTGWSALLRVAMGVLLLLPAGRRGRLVQSTGLLLITGLAGLATAYRDLATLASPTHTLHLVAVAGISLGYGLVSAIRRPPQLDWVPSVAAATLLAGFTINSHAFGRGPAAVIADWTHLLAAALWIGGLASLFLVTRAHRFGGPPTPVETPFISALVARWSRAVGISLGVLVVTGFYGILLHIPAVSAFTQTAYGRALGVKLLLVAALAGLGALNHFVFRPYPAALVRTRPPLRFVRAVVGEIGLGAVVLLVVAVLTITPPANVVSISAARQPLRLTGIAGASGRIEIRFSLTPAQPGWNTYEVEVASGGGFSSEPARVLLRLTHLETPLTPVLVRLSGSEGGRFATSGGELALPGWWEVDVILRRAGQPDDVVTFPLRLGTASGRPPEPTAVALLERARRTAGSFRSWRQNEQITDGKGGGVLAVFDLQPPDRMRYRTSSGQEAIIVGTRRFVRSDSGPWGADTLPDPLKLDGLDQYLRDPEGARMGRTDSCDNEPCQIVLWQAPGGSAAFAGLIGTRSGWVYRLLMVAPAHFMTLRVYDINAPIHITPP
jgi:copper transport protein